VAASLVGVILLLPRQLAKWLVAGYVKRLDQQRDSVWPKMLDETELFVNPPWPKFGYWALARSFFSSSVYNAPQLIFPCAVLLLLVPQNWMTFGVVVALPATALVLAIAGVHDRLNAMLQISRRGLFLGMPLLLSCAVIALAVLRYFRFSYVSTILESARFHVILIYLLIAYVTMWFYEAWTAQLLCERLLALFDRSDRECVKRVPYSFQRRDAR